MNTSPVLKKVIKIETFIDFYLIFQSFSEETSTVLLIIFLILGLFGFLLLIFLLSTACIILTVDMIELINNEDVDNEDTEGIDNCRNTTRIVKQSERR